MNDGWAEDLLFLSLFAAYGRLDPLNRIAANLAEANDLAELLGRVLLDLILANDRFALHRRQIIQYTSFDLDGDFDPVELTTYDEDGWKQTGYRFTTNNVYTATISEACRVLIDHVRDGTTRNLLRSRVQRFGAQTNRPIIDAQRLPARFTRWQEAFDLAQAILSGAGLRSGQGVLRTLGFTISTWQTWETLVERSLVIALGASDVRLQPRCKLGSFKRGSASRDVFVQPDAIITSKDERLIVDAKYKGRAGDDGSAISVGDRYEVLAFMHAAEIDKAILLYPATKDLGSCGEWSMTETLNLPIGTVRAYSITMTGISRINGFTRFTNGLREIIKSELD